MRVLLLSNIYPTRANPIAGTFIAARVSALEELGVQVAPVGLRPAFRWTARQMRRLAGLESILPAAAEPFMTVDMVMGAPNAWRREAAMLFRGWAVKSAERIERTIGATWDVIHAHGMYDLPAGMVAEALAHRTGRPFVISMHGSDANQVFPGRAALYSGVVRSAGAVIYVSSALQERVEGLGGAHGNAFVIPNGVNTSLFRPRKKRPLSVLFVGNLEPVKGVDRLPQIWREVKAHCPDATLTIVGDGSMRSMLESDLQNQALFAGRQPPSVVAQYMGESCVLILPSRSEGWPTVIMESYAASTPVVATKVGGVGEAVIHDECVITDGPELTSRFASAVCQVLTSPENYALGLRERARAHEWSEIARRELRVYIRLLESRGEP